MSQTIGQCLASLYSNGLLNRDSFYCFKQLYETGGEEALQALSRQKPNLKNRVPLHIEAKVLECATQFPAFGLRSK